MIDHVSIGVSDFDRSRAFYETALAPLGVRHLFDVPGDHSGGVRATGFGEDRGWFWIADERPTTGLLHIAFEARTHAEVDAFHAAALRAGGTCNGPPGPRPEYHPDYYAAFVLDPDGHNIEAVCRAPGATDRAV